MAYDKISTCGGLKYNTSCWFKERGNKNDYRSNKNSYKSRR